MAVKSAKTRSGRKARRQTLRQPGMSEVLYDRVTGQAQDAVILPVVPMPHRITISLRADQRATLDQAARRIARTSGEAVSVAAIIRGVLDAVTGADLDLSGCRSEADVRAAVGSMLARGSRRRAKRDPRR